MKREGYSLRLIGCWLVAGIVLGVLASNVSAQKSKKFLTGPLTIEDQGSFFIGGVPKVTEYAAPAPAAGAPAAAVAAASAPHQITVGQMYVQFEIPANKYWRRLAGDHGARLESHRCVPGVHARWPRRLVSILRSQGRPQLRRRSSRTRSIWLRRISDPRRGSQDGGR